MAIRTNDNDQPNPKDHDRILAAAAYYRFPSGWFAGAFGHSVAGVVQRAEVQLRLCEPLISRLRYERAASPKSLGTPLSFSIPKAKIELCVRIPRLAGFAPAVPPREPPNVVPKRTRHECWREDISVCRNLECIVALRQ